MKKSKITKAQVAPLTSTLLSYRAAVKRYMLSAAEIRRLTK